MSICFTTPCTGDAANICHATPQVDQDMIGVLSQLPGNHPVPGMPAPVATTPKFLYPMTQYSSKTPPPGSCELSSNGPYFAKRDSQCQKLDVWPGGSTSPPPSDEGEASISTDGASAAKSAVKPAGTGKVQPTGASKFLVILDRLSDRFIGSSDDEPTIDSSAGRTPAFGSLVLFFQLGSLYALF
jgi:hypothetical protein